MSDGMQALHSGMDERFGHIIADDRMMDKIIYTCVHSRRAHTRFPIKMVNVLVACAAVLLFAAMTVLLNNSGILARKQASNAAPPPARLPDNTPIVSPAAASVILTCGEGVTTAVAMLVTLTPKLADNGLYGYVDENGEYVIPAKYTEAEPFKGDKAKVVLEGKHVIIDIKGEIIDE